MESNLGIPRGAVEHKVAVACLCHPPNCHLGPGEASEQEAYLSAPLTACSPYQSTR